MTTLCAKPLDNRERAFIAYKVEGRTAAAVARELDCSAAAVLKWSRVFEKENPERAASMLGAVSPAPQAAPATPPALSWLQRAGGPTPPSDPPPAPAPQAEDAEDDDTPAEPLPDDATALQQVKHQIRELRRFITKAQRLGNLDIAARFSVLVVTLVNAQRQLEKASRADDGLIVVSKGDVDAALKEIDGKVAALEASELRCADCGRIMRRKKADE